MVLNKTVKSGTWLMSFIFLINLQFSLGKTSPHPIVLVVSFDGFKPDYLNKGLTPTLDSLRKTGVEVPYMEPVFPTNTYPNYQSIVTGLYPETHGVVDNELWEPKLGRRLSGFRPDHGFFNYDPEVLPIWIRNEMAGKGRVSACIGWPGCDQTFGRNDDLRPTYSHSGKGYGWNERVERIISWLTDNSKPANLAFIYNEYPDDTSHPFGPNHPQNMEQLGRVDERMEFLVRRLKEAGIFNQVNIIVVSDHGVEEVGRGKIINMYRLIDHSLLDIKLWSTVVIQLKPIQGKGEELYRKLKEHSRHYNFTIYKKSELRGYPWHYANSRRILDYVLVPDLGWFFDEDYDKGGEHGYPIWNKSMRALFLASGPAFKKGWKGRRPIKNVDVVPLISKIIKLEGIPYNGSWNRVKGMVQPGNILLKTNVRMVKNFTLPKLFGLNI